MCHNVQILNDAALNVYVGVSPFEHCMPWLVPPDSFPRMHGTGQHSGQNSSSFPRLWTSTLSSLPDMAASKPTTTSRSPSGYTNTPVRPQEKSILNTYLKKNTVWSMNIRKTKLLIVNSFLITVNWLQFYTRMNTSSKFFICEVVYIQNHEHSVELMSWTLVWSVELMNRQNKKCPCAFLLMVSLPARPM